MPWVVNCNDLFNSKDEFDLDVHVVVHHHRRRFRYRHSDWYIITGVIIHLLSVIIIPWRLGFSVGDDHPRVTRGHLFGTLLSGK